MPKLLDGRFGQRAHNACSQQVDRVPDAALRNETEKYCDDGHRDCTGQAAPKTCRIGMYLRLDLDAVILIEVVYFCAPFRYFNVRTNSHDLLFLIWQHI